MVGIPPFDPSLTIDFPAKLIYLDFQTRSICFSHAKFSRGSIHKSLLWLMTNPKIHVIRILVKIDSCINMCVTRSRELTLRVALILFRISIKALLNLVHLQLFFSFFYFPALNSVSYIIISFILYLNKYFWAWILNEIS